MTTGAVGMFQRVMTSPIVLALLVLTGVLAQGEHAHHH